MEHISWERKIVKVYTVVFTILFTRFMYSYISKPFLSELEIIGMLLSGFGLLYSVMKLIFNIDVLKGLAISLLVSYAILFIIIFLISFIIIIF